MNLTALAIALVALSCPHATNLHVYDPATNITTIFDKGRPTCSFPGQAHEHDDVDVDLTAIDESDMDIQLLDRVAGLRVHHQNRQ